MFSMNDTNTPKKKGNGDAKRYALNLIFLVVGAAVMYGVWLYNDNTRLTEELMACEVDAVSALDAQIEAQAEVELLKNDGLR